MSFENRRELLFVYTVKDANPNGDPLNANHPRYDEDAGQLLVSDVRIKRTIRDQWVRDGLNVFVDGEPKTLKTRFEELKKKTNGQTGEEVLSQCIDARLFGATFALGSESFSWTGPVQFKWGRSLNRSRVELVQGTAAFVSREGSEQRSFRNEYIVPFAVIAAYAIANQYPSKVTGATDADLDLLIDGMWDGTVNLITRSKVGHEPQLILQVVYNEGFNGITGSLDDRVKLVDDEGRCLSEEEQLALRSLANIQLDVSELSDAILYHDEAIELVDIIHSKDVKLLGLERLSQLGNRLAVEKR